MEQGNFKVAYFVAADSGVQQETLRPNKGTREKTQKPAEKKVRGWFNVLKPCPISGHEEKRRGIEPKKTRCFKSSREG